jgi:glycosyltransferase involved in cell wall biosynthesis
MKLLQIGPYPPPLGGWSFHIRMFKQHLDYKGIENVVMNMGPNRQKKSDEYVDVQSGIDYVFKISKFCRQGYTVYPHLNGNSVKGLILTLIAQILAFVFKKKSVLSFHAGVVQSCFSKQWGIHKLFARACFKMAHGIICNSEQVKNQIQFLGINPSKIAAIPCFSRQYVHHKTILTSRESAFLQQFSPVFMSYLFFRKEYDPDTLFSALPEIKKNFPAFGLIIAGPENGGEAYMAQAEAADLHRHILQCGEKNHDNFLSLVAKSDLMIRTPVSDGVCSSVMEALALGIPVVASDNGTRPSGAVLFALGNSDDLAEKVKMTMDNLAQIKSSLSGIFDRDTIQEESVFIINTHLIQ